MHVVNEHIPLVTPKVKNKHLQVWMTQDTMHQITNIDKFNARAKQSQLARVIYKRIRNDVVKQIAKAKSNYLGHKILERIKILMQKKLVEAFKTKSTHKVH